MIVVVMIIPVNSFGNIVSDGFSQRLSQTLILNMKEITSLGDDNNYVEAVYTDYTNDKFDTINHNDNTKDINN